MKVTAQGFNSILLDSVQVVITETTQVDANLTVAGVIVDPVVVRIAPLIQKDGPQLGRVVDSRAVSELPLATRNFTQILGLSPGTAVDLPDNTSVGRNSQNVSVNGARATQNKGGLHRTTGTPMGQPIPAKKLAAAAAGKFGAKGEKQAQLAKTLGRLRK